MFRRPVALSAVAISCLLGACSSDATPAPAGSSAPIATDAAAADGTDAPDSTDSTDAPSSSAAAPTEAAGAPFSSLGAGLTQATVDLLLLAPKDMFTTGFNAGDPNPPPLPCGGDVDAAVPPIVRTGVFLAHPDLVLAVQQELRVYATSQLAATAYADIVTGYTCATSTDGSLTIGQPQVVTSDVIGSDEATAFSVNGEGTEGAAVVVHYADSVELYLFVGKTGGAAAAGAPSPIDVATAATQKIIVGLTG